MAMQVILLERVESLGNLGDVVNVKPGYARNYLIPQSKALRATEDNIAYFETQKKEIEKRNETRRKEAEKEAKPLEGKTFIMVRLASEGGQLYGSVTSRDIADVVSEQSKVAVQRNMIDMNQNYKTIGLFPVSIALHPEVKVEVTINIARSEEEAKLQEKSGKALIAAEEAQAAEEAASKEDDSVKKELMEESALAAEKEREEEEAVREAEEAEKSAKKSEARAEKKAAAKEAEEAEAAEAEEGAAEASAESEEE